MPVTQVLKDPSALTMTVIADLDATVERAWQLIADPRQLERWWGPPEYPATVVEHNLTPGGRVTYYMTGPTGDTHHGSWRVIGVDPPRSLDVEDGFADAEGNPDPNMPTGTMRLSLEGTATGTRLSVVSTFASLETMEQLLAMGQEEGMKAAMGQIDRILKTAA